MHKNTTELLKTLLAEKWFRAVGKDVGQSALLARSWQQALRSCRAYSWSLAHNRSANQIREAVTAQSPEEYYRWNELVDSLKPLTSKIVLQKTQEVVAKSQLSKVFLDNVHWDILMSCLETEYSYVAPPGFYSELVKWYIEGHFPCGWKGRYPKGTLIVY